MRDILVFAFVMLSLPTCFQRPFYGLLVFSWLAYMRPQDLCWGFARTMRLSFFVAVAMVGGWWAVERGRRSFAAWDFRTRSIVLLGLLVAISYAFAKFHTKYTNTYFLEFVKILAIALFTTGQVDTKARFKTMCWTIAACLAFFGIKGGLFGVLSGGGQILRGPGGMMEDNNDFALALVMNIPLLWYLGMAEQDRPWVAKFTKIALGLTVITVVLTHSRGGFLAMTATALWIAWRSGKIMRAATILVLLAVLFPLVAPQEVLERLGSIGDAKESSAAARLMAWATAFNMIGANPLLGVGMRNFQPRYREYSVVPLSDTSNTYVAHNSYLQIWAESGTLAFAVYFVLLVSILLTSRRLFRLGRSRADLHWISDYARMMEATTVGFMVGAFFLNRGHFDLIYHWIALVTALVAVSYKAARAAPSVEEAPGLRGGGVGRIEVGWQDAGRVAASTAGVMRPGPQWRRRT